MRENVVVFCPTPKAKYFSPRDSTRRWTNQWT